MNKTARLLEVTNDIVAVVSVKYWGFCGKPCANLKGHFRNANFLGKKPFSEKTPHPFFEGLILDKIRIFVLDRLLVGDFP